MKKIPKNSKYDPKYCKKIIDYFANHEKYIKEGKRLSNEYPTIFDFVKENDLSYYVPKTWALKYEEFATALKIAKEIQHQIIIKNAFKGVFNSSFSIFALKNLAHWRDKSKEEINDEKDAQIEVLKTLSTLDTDSLRNIANGSAESSSRKRSFQSN